MEKYSVLMSVYKKAGVEEFRLSVKSILEQTYPPDQFVIVCDGPIEKDLRDEIKWLKESNKSLFTIVKLKSNHGLAYALNEGLKVCRNDLVARMDADDYSLPKRCEIQVDEYQKNPNLALLGGYTKHFRKDISDVSEKVNTFPINMNDIKKTFRRECPFSHPAMMYRKKAVLACGGYDSQLRRSQDHDLFSKMISNGYEGSNVNKVLLYFRANDECLARNKNRESCKIRVLLQKRMLQRGDCSLFDFLYIWIAMLVSRIMPVPIYRKIYAIIKKSGD
ncbi:MAG: glycosyltransferase [bacterium]|nr:glycosyltransferase [bacterium]